MHRYAWLPVLFMLVFPVSVSAQTKLAWRFKQGDRFYVEETTGVRQTIKILNTDTRQNFEEIKVSRFTVLKTEKDGTVLEQTIQSAKIKHDGEGPDVDTQVLKQFEGASFRVSLDARGQVTKLNGYDELLKKIAKDDPLDAKLARILMTEESFKTALAGLFGWVPEKAVANGTGWEHKSVLRLGPLGAIKLENRYVLDAVDKAMMSAGISVTNKGTYALPEKAADPALKVSGGEIRLLSSSGKLSFDAAHGRLLRSEVKTRLAGMLQVTVRDAPVAMELEQERTQKVQVFDKDPGARRASEGTHGGN